MSICQQIWFGLDLPHLSEASAHWEHHVILDPRPGALNEGGGRDLPSLHRIYNRHTCRNTETQIDTQMQTHVHTDIYMLRNTHTKRINVHI